MDSNIKASYTSIIKSLEYKESLDKMTVSITNAAKKAPNEATIESRFDMELFAFFKQYFEPLGFEYNPTKESSIETRRHVSKGRADTAISALVIEFKQPSTLKNDKQKTKAIRQISDYLLGLQSDNEETMEGFVTDGVQGCFVTCANKTIVCESFLPLRAFDLDRIIQNILSLKLIAFNSNNLVESFCNPPLNDGIAFKLVDVLFSTLKSSMQTKTKMLFVEWKELFNLAHDDISKQQAIIDRRESLEALLECKFDNIDDEYLGLFALQTAYAIIIKLIAFKLLSQIRFDKSLINYADSISMKSEPLRIQFSRMENGAIFREYGMTNLLEGDFFSWYCSSSQWSEELAIILKEIFELLSRYSDKAVLNNSKRTQDFFKQLYETMIPAAVRHSLGEYYTKKWLAEKVVDDAIDLCKNPEWKGLDPCCGSGTFLNVMIDRVLRQKKDASNEEKLNSVLHRVKGIDLNPIAVLTARVNYFINISHLIDDDRPIDIPVYLGDSSYVPQHTVYDNVASIEYVITTTKDPIRVLLPQSIVDNPSAFAQKMILVETQVKNQNEEAVTEILKSLVSEADLTEKTCYKIMELSKSLVELEKKDWNGIWARILANYLATANMGLFDVIVGNPPWVDWKSLPSGYRERIKSLCISRKLFSGDRVTGGINLNICALITNVVAENWMASDGVLGFLMPEPLVFQPSYEGFRNLYVKGDKRLYFCKFTNWTKAGNPFKPVTQKFLTFYISERKMDYARGIETEWYIKKRGANIDREEINIDECFDVQTALLAACNEKKNFFSNVKSASELTSYSNTGGVSEYIGREGIEFYPQELMVFSLSDLKGTANCTCLRNLQNKKSKYRVPSFDVLLETEFLFPMIKGKNVVPFHVKWDEYIVPFPYSRENPQIPIDMKTLSKKAPKLAKYYQDYKELILEQTGYNEKIIGKKDAEFYALARVGEYSYASNYVVFRDNTKWAAAVISEIDTPWGGKKRPLFQNHAVSICEDTKGRFITFDEAHYICAIMNAPSTYNYMMNSSDKRSFPIRPRIYIPKYDETNNLHKQLSDLSKEAHLKFDNRDEVERIMKTIDLLYKRMMDSQS